MSSIKPDSRNSTDSTCRAFDDGMDKGEMLTLWEPSARDLMPAGSFIVLVAEGGRKILIRHEGNVMSAAHKVQPSESFYEHAKQFREQVCSYFGMTAHTQVVIDVSLRNFPKTYSFDITIVEVNGDASSAVPAVPFVWIDWMNSALDLNECCPHSHITRFLVCYLGNKHVQEIHLVATPWRQLGFYSYVIHRFQQLVSAAGHEVTGNPEQVHYGSFSTIYEIPTTHGLLFGKIGFKGNCELLKTKTITTMFPNDTPRVVEEDVNLELMIYEDHGPSVSAAYFGRRFDRQLDDCELRSIFGAALTQWARVQKESINRVQELTAYGIPSHDEHWIRSSFSELMTYMKETELDVVYPEVLRFETHMDRTFEVWERFGIPRTLVHGDMHDGNIAEAHGAGTDFVFFDWDSSFIGHPFLDLARNDTALLLGQEAYLKCWKAYGDIAALKKLVVWTRPMYFMIEAICAMRKSIWTDRERRVEVRYHLGRLAEAWEECDFEKDCKILLA